MKLLGKRLAFAVALALTLVTLGARQSMVLAQETDDPVKIEIYKRFVDNRIPNPTVAYQAARDFVTRYPKEKSEYSDYIKQWMMFYERDERKQRLIKFPARYDAVVTQPERQVVGERDQSHVQARDRQAPVFEQPTANIFA